MKKSAIFVLILMVVMVFSISAGASEIEMGVIQIVEHPSLDASYQGFVDALNELGYQEDEDVIYDHQNAQGDMATAQNIAQKFVNDNKDMVLSIATPTSQAMVQATQEIPILITAVTDPVEAGLVESMEKPGNNVTGTTDLTPVKTQLELLQDILPEATQVGVIYNAGEVNSLVQVEIARESANDLDLQIIEATATTSGEVLQAAQSLVGRVDAFYVPTCNTAVSALESIIMIAEDNNIPLIVGEDDSVERGGLATTGISYYELGYQTGVMAAEVLEGAVPAEMPIQSADKVETVLNTEAAEAMGVTFSEELLEQADKIIEKTVEEDAD